MKWTRRSSAVEKWGVGTTFFSLTAGDGGVQFGSIHRGPVLGVQREEMDPAVLRR
jgi:hypothetical protein